MVSYSEKDTGEKQFVSFYEDETVRLYDDWRDKRVEVVKHNGQEWLVVTGLDQNGQRKVAEPVHFMPFYEKIEEEIDAARRDGEYNNRLAPRIGIYPSELTNLVSPSPRKKRYQSVMVNIFLETPRIPDAKTADHTLMMLRQSCLYLDSYDLQINQRNYIIRCVLDYGAEQTARGGADGRNWVLFMQDVLRYFNLPGTWRPAKKERAAYELGRKDFVPDGEEKLLLAQWEEGLKKIGKRDYTDFRGAMKRKYEPEREMSASRYSRILINRIEQFAPYVLTERTVASFFAGSMDSDQNKCTREGVITIGIAMGCSLEEINRLLQDINEAVLYPRSSWPEDRQYVDWIVKHPFR